MSEVLIHDDDEEYDFRKEIMGIVQFDDRDAFINAVKFLGVRTCPPDVFFYIAHCDAVDCATALLEGETDLTVDLNVPTSLGPTPMGEIYPLHVAAEIMSPKMIDLYLRHGARTDIKTKGGELIKGSFLPLNVALEMLSHHRCLVDWTPKDSILKLIVLLCLPEMKIPFEVNRLLAQNTERLDDVFCYYAMEGKLIEMAALLSVAREDVMDSFDGSMDIRQFLVEEIVKLTSEEKKLTGFGDRAKWGSAFKHKRLVMTSALELLGVFERAGDDIDAYVRSVKSEMTEQEVLKDITFILEEAGFILKSEDIDLSNIDCGSERFKLETLVSEKRIDDGCRLPDIGIPFHSQSGSFPSQNISVTEKGNEVALALMEKKNNELAQSALRFFQGRSPLSQSRMRFIHTTSFSWSCEVLKKTTGTKKNLPDLLSTNTCARFALLLKRGMRRI